VCSSDLGRETEHRQRVPLAVSAYRIQLEVFEAVTGLLPL
jgi:hypothetical protein